MSGKLRAKIQEVCEQQGLTPQAADSLARALKPVVKDFFRKRLLDAYSRELRLEMVADSWEKIARKQDRIIATEQAGSLREQLAQVNQELLAAQKRLATYQAQYRLAKAERDALRAASPLMEALTAEAP